MEGKAFFDLHEIDDLVALRLGCKTDNPVALVRMSSDFWLAARKGAVPEERVR
jgi:hypothetical protein